MATPDLRSAATTYDQKVAGRLSYSSRENHATGPDSAAAHNARAIVLPAPAVPVTTVNGHDRAPWAISLVMCGRGSAQSGTSGAVTLDARTGSQANAPDHLEPVTTCLAAWVAMKTSAGSWPGHPDRPPVGISPARLRHHNVTSGAAHDWWVNRPLALKEPQPKGLRHRLVP